MHPESHSQYGELPQVEKETNGFTFSPFVCGRCRIRTYGATFSRPRFSKPLQLTSLPIFHLPILKDLNLPKNRCIYHLVPILRLVVVSKNCATWNRNNFGLQFAEEEGFEPPVRCRTMVFKTITINHSDTLPKKWTPVCETWTHLHPSIGSITSYANQQVAILRCNMNTSSGIVVLRRFELRTPNLSGWCSNQLSYRTMLFFFIFLDFSTDINGNNGKHGSQ